jgi:ABC-type amino acid transport substrate-binding protein
MSIDNRRWLRLLAALVMVLLLGAACGEEAPDSEPTGSGDETSADEPQFSTIEDGVLKVGSCLDYRPFEFVKNGEEMGFDVEISEEIANRLGLEIEWVRANFDTIFTAVAGGSEFDMVAAASTITEERLQIVDFSDPYFNSRQALTVNTDETPDITSTSDLGEGDVVGVQKGTTGKAWAEENLAPQGVQIKTFEAVPQAFTDLEAGAVAAVVNDEGSSIGEIESRPGLEVVEAIDTDEKYGLAFSQDNPELTEAVNGALAEMIADGTYEQIFTKWFPDLPVPEEFAAS